MVVTIADDQAVPPSIALVRQISYVGVDFRLQRGGQHAPRTFADDVVDQGAISRGGVVIHYGEHGRAFPTDARNVGLLGDHHRIIREGTPSTCPPGLIHRY
jgi:hypothetical protein